jgi:hypothetical protein
MTDDRLSELLAAHAGPAEVALGFEDRLFAQLLQERRRSGRLARPSLLLVAALLATLAISAAVGIGSGVLRLPRLDESAPPNPAESIRPTGGSPEPSATLLPELSLPGSRGDEPAGVYGWTGGLGASTGMHHVIGNANNFRQTQLVFSIREDCFGAAGNPIPVTVAGLNGLYLEPYKAERGEPIVTFIYPPRGGETTGGYALPIDDRTLCVYLTWDPQTTRGELEEARQVVESIRGEPYGVDGVRIIFTVPARWDTG